MIVTAVELAELEPEIFRIEKTGEGETLQYWYLYECNEMFLSVGVSEGKEPFYGIAFSVEQRKVLDNINQYFIKSILI